MTADNKVVFHNPLDMIISAAKYVYPNLTCVIQIDPRLECPPYGETIFADTGEIIVSLAGKITIEQSLEILAHELSHVIVGEKEGHGDKWETVFEAIFRRYTAICSTEASEAKED